jgi:hypothetical protein
MRLMRTVPPRAENVFSTAEHVTIDPYNYHPDHQLQISNLRYKLSSNLALSISQSTFGYSFAGLAINDRLFAKSTPLSCLTSVGHITSTIFAYEDSAAPPKERYVQPLGTRLIQTVISHICSKCRLIANAKPVLNSFLEVESRISDPIEW